MKNFQLTKLFTLLSFATISDQAFAGKNEDKLATVLCLQKKQNLAPDLFQEITNFMPPLSSRQMTDWIAKNIKGKPLSPEAFEEAKTLAPLFDRAELMAAVFGKNVDPSVKTSDFSIIYQYAAYQAASDAYNDAIFADDATYDAAYAIVADDAAFHAAIAAYYDADYRHAYHDARAAFHAVALDAYRDVALGVGFKASLAAAEVAYKASYELAKAKIKSLKQ
jgi:hypothetical protein